MTMTLPLLEQVLIGDRSGDPETGLNREIYFLNLKLS